MKILSRRLSCIKNWTPEELVLLYSSRTKLSPDIQEKLAVLLERDLDWQWIKDKSIVHGVVPLLDHTLGRNEFLNVPGEIRQWLRQVRMVNLIRNLRIRDEKDKLLSLLADNSITAVPFKGTDLAANVYGDISYRQVTDIDLFIRKNDALRVNKLLKRSGYIVSRNMNGESDPDVPFLGFYNADKKIHIDMQWEIYANSISFGYIKNDFWDRIIENSVNGQKRWQFADVDLFMLLCLHGTRHQWSHLKWLCDITEFVHHNKDMEWPWIIKTARDNYTVRILSICLILAREMMCCRWADKVLDIISPDGMSRYLSRKIIDGYFSGNLNRVTEKQKSEKKILNNEFLFHIHSRERSKYKLKILKSHLYMLAKPNRHDRIVDLPEKLYFIYFVIRFHRLLFKYGYKLVHSVIYYFIMKK